MWIGIVTCDCALPPAVIKLPYWILLSNWQHQWYVLKLICCKSKFKCQIRNLLFVVSSVLCIAIFAICCSKRVQLGKGVLCYFILFYFIFIRKETVSNQELNLAATTVQLTRWTAGYVVFGLGDCNMIWLLSVTDSVYHCLFWPYWLSLIWYRSGRLDLAQLNRYGAAPYVLYLHYGSRIQSNKESGLHYGSRYALIWFH